MGTFADKKGRVLVVEPIGGLRDAIRQAVGRLGFTRIDAVNTPAQALRFLEVEEEAPFWIVTSMASDAPVNALQLLAVLAGDSALKAVRVSLLYRAADTVCLPKAFELGLMSCHPVENANVGRVTEELGGLLARLGANDYDTCVVAAAYLRERLLEAKQYPAMLALESAMMRVYPRQPARLVSMAEAYFLLGKKTEATSTLSQARYLSPVLAAQADELCRRFLGEEGKVPNRIADVFRLRSAVIVDPDEAVRRNLHDVLGSVGIRRVEGFAGPKEALAWLKQHGEPSLFVMEWKLPDLQGIAFLQRLRALGYHNALVVVASSLIKTLHKNLLGELGVGFAIEKPVMRESFLKELVAALRAGFMPNQYRVTLRKIDQLLVQEKVLAARNLANQLMGSKEPLPPAVQDLLEARLRYAEERYEESREIVQRLLQLEPDNLAYLDLLGKVLMRLGDHEAAVMCLQRANALAPDNLERACGIADAYTELGELDLAEERIGSVRGIDPESPALLQSEVKHALASGKLEEAKSSLAALEMTSTVFGYMNNRAVAFARSGRHDRAVTMYADILAVLPEKHVEMLGAVRYNLGLVHVRRGDLDAARTVLAHVAALGSVRVQAKVQSLLAKVEGAITSGETLQLTDADREVRSGPPRAQSSGGALPGELCCLGIFHAPPEPSVLPLLASKPAFKRRDVIQRGQTTGKSKSYG